MIQFSYRKLLVSVGAVLVLGVAAIGVTAVQAQTTPASPSPTAQTQRQKFVTALANRLHISVDQLQQAITGARQDAGLPAQPQRPNRTRPTTGARGFGGLLGQEADAVAGLFHEDRTALMNELPGKTLAEVAAAHGVQTQDLVNAIVNAANQRIDQTAQQRNISADRVAQMKQRISERVQAFVTTHRFPARDTGSRS